MANVLHLIIVLVCVSFVNSRDARGSSLRHMMMHKRSIFGNDIYDGFKEYEYCYKYFMRLYVDNVLTYRDVCHVRDKLKLCVDRVIAEYPRLEKIITKGYDDVAELLSDFWCTYNLTHHGPAEPFDNMADMYRKYIECPYVHDPLLTHEDYSPSIYLPVYRAQFADNILKWTGDAGLSPWLLNQKYSDPQDPVYKALSAISCDQSYKREPYITDSIMSRYCVIVKYIRSDLIDVMDVYYRHSVGLYNWTTSLCTKYEDPLEQTMRLSRLDKWLSYQKKPDLSPCHDHNIYIEGATCLIMFHTRLPPFTDLYNFMPPFFKSIPELNSCWDRVSFGCPQPSSASKSISLLIELYNLASDISKEDSSQVWDVIWRWSDLYKKTEDAQWKLQLLYTLRSPMGFSDSPYPLAFGSSLNEALSHHKSSLSHNITDLFSNLASALYKLSVVANDDYSGVNIFEGFSSMNEHVQDILFGCVCSLYELFVEVGEFVQYNGRCPEWWSLPCE